MENKLNKTLIIYCLSFYFIGFLFKDFTPAGAKLDFFNYTWPAIQEFKRDFVNSIIYYGKFGDASYPLFYIFNSYLNPFSKSIFLYHLSSAITGLITFYIFALAIKKANNLNNINSISLASIILLLPFFISRNYWGTSSYLAWLSFVISLYFFLSIFSYNINDKKKLIFCTLFCFFSSISIYIKPVFVFLPIFFITKVFIEEKIKIKIFCSLLYLIFALPGFYLIYIWGGLIAVDIQNPMSETIHIHPGNIIKNSIILPTLFLFYLMPFFIFSFFNKSIFILISKHLVTFSIFFLSLLFLDFSGFLDYLKFQDFGGGIFLKVNNLLIKDYLYFFLFTSACGFSIIYNIIKIKPKYNLFLFILIFLFLGLPKILYQDYLEPLIIFLIYTNIMKHDYFKFNDKNSKLITLISVLYYSFYLFGSVIFKQL